MQSLAKHTLTNMAIPFLNNINLDDNQLQNAKLHVTSSAPTAAAGQIYFDSTVGTETAKYYDGSTWISLIQYTTANSTFVNLAESGTDATRTLTASLSATGTPSATTFLRGDNTWASISDNDTTYDLTGTGSTNGTAGVLLTGSDATTDTVLIVGSGTTTVTRSGNTLTVTSNDQYDGTVTSVDTGNSTFISGSGGPITSSGTLTYSLSATGTPDNTKYLRGDNTWSAISGIYSWDIAGDTGSETIVNGDTVTFAGGTNVTTAYDTGTNTLTINSTDQYVGTVTSVGLSMPSAFTVTNSPVTSSGTLTVTGAGTVSQYIDGTGALQTFPTSDVGAIVAAAVLYLIVSGKSGFESVGGFASNGYGELSPDGYGLTSVIIAEMVLTAFFLLVILGSTNARAPKGFAPIAIGLALTLIHLISIPISNTSVNPTRSLSQALFSDGAHLAQVWVFWVAPIVGAIIGGIIHKALFEKE